MSKHFFNYDSGEYEFATTDTLGYSFDGHMLMRMSKNMVMDMETGNLEMISGWPDDEDESFEDD